VSKQGPRFARRPIEFGHGIGIGHRARHHWNNDAERRRSAKKIQRSEIFCSVLCDLIASSGNGKFPEVRGELRFAFRLRGGAE
jgi:hypothetical protein